VATRLGLFALTLAVVFAAADGVGAVAGPTPPVEPSHDGAVAGGHEEPGAAGGHEGAASGPGGLAVAAEGYALRQVAAPVAAGAPGEYAFRIVDIHQQRVTGFQDSHERRLHLIVVRRDLTGFQHLHPEMDAGGTWRVPMTLPAAGVWRVFADFRPDGRDGQVILGTDVQVGGDFAPAPLPAPTATTTVDDYLVTADGALAAGQTSRLTMRLARAGTPVTDLQPYLGAYGHLVALRAGDLAYLHVHPQDSAVAGPEIAFDVEVPTPGTYRLFLDFQHGGVVRTASLTAVA
jgi:hypothetical protein